MVKVQNVLNYGTADVSDELVEQLGARWALGDSLVRPPFVPPWEQQPGGEPEPMPEATITLQKVNVTYKSGGVCDFTAVKGAVNDPDGDESFFFTCAEDTTLNGYTGRVFTRTFPTAGPYNCSLEDNFGDGTGDPASRAKVSFVVNPTLVTADPGVAPVAAPKKTTTRKKAPVAVKG